MRCAEYRRGGTNDARACRAPDHAGLAILATGKKTMLLRMRQARARAARRPEAAGTDGRGAGVVLQMRASVSLFFALRARGPTHKVRSASGLGHSACVHVTTACTPT
eukprot:366559-Chlamydomonas_euryale.AAC.9